jgi:long-subunit acyl-CoA synthetase (AMP-forming)
VLDSLPAIKAILVWGVDRIPEDLQKDNRIMTFRAFLQLGSDVPDGTLQPGIERQRPGQCVCLIYTSGTTGHPKGVMLSHDNLLYSGSAVAADVLGSLPREEAVVLAE